MPILAVAAKAYRDGTPAIVEISMTQALVLFDIDGTLLRRAGPHHREALVKAVRKRDRARDHHRRRAGAGHARPRYL